MRHKYSTAAIVLARTPLSEASSLVTLLTSEVGLVRARAQGLRKPGAKMASALQTLIESDVMLLKGKEGWRLAGALRTQDWFSGLTPATRIRAGRIANLLLRLLSGEVSDPILFVIFITFLRALTPTSDSIGSTDESELEVLHDAIECLAALRILHALGFDAGEIPDDVAGSYEPEVLQHVINHRSEFISRINRGIGASGL